MSENVTGSVLVVGGGIAGMQSALDLANSGYYVYLLEKSPSIGGVMSQLDKTFPTNDCEILRHMCCRRRVTLTLKSARVAVNAPLSALLNWRTSMISVFP